MKKSKLKQLIKEEISSIVEAVDDASFTVKMYADEEAAKEPDALPIVEFKYTPLGTDTIPAAIERALDIAEDRAEEDNIKIDYIEFYLKYDGETVFIGYAIGGEFQPIYKLMNENLKSALTVGMLALALAATPDKAGAQDRSPQQSPVEVVDEKKFSDVEEFLQYFKDNIEDMYDMFSTGRKNGIVVTISGKPALVTVGISKGMQLAMDKAELNGRVYSQGLSLEQYNQRHISKLNNGLYIAAVAYEKR